MKSGLLTTTYSLLTAAGLIALLRVLHPATFSQSTLWIVLLIMFLSASLVVVRQG